MNTEVSRLDVSVEVACHVDLLYRILHLLSQVNHHRLVIASGFLLFQLDVLLDRVFQVLHDQEAPTFKLPMCLVSGQPIILRGVFLQERGF